MDEKTFRIILESGERVPWRVALKTADSAKLPFMKIGAKRVDCRFQEMEFSASAETGSFAGSPGRRGFEIQPEEGQIVLNLAVRR